MVRRIKKSRMALSMVVTNAIILASIGVIGTSLLIWANSQFTVEKQSASKLLATRIDAIKESFMIEDIWFQTSPKYVNVTIRNLGSIPINVTSISFNGTVIWNRGLIIQSNEAPTIKVEFNWQVGRYLVSVETKRGNIVQGYWRTPN